MPAFGQASAARLATCDERLQRLFQEVVKTFDCTIIEGHRGEAAQHLAFVTGKSKLDWPNGNHNAKPSKAVDVAPFPVDWTDQKDRKSTRLNSSHIQKSRMPSSA